MKVSSRFILFGLILSLAQLGFVTTAAAQDAGKKKTTVVYEKETTMSFDDTLVEGKVVKPDGFFLLRKRPKKWQDLLIIRDNYNEELASMKLDL